MSKPKRRTFDDPTGYMGDDFDYYDADEMGDDFDYYDADEMDAWLTDTVLPVLRGIDYISSGDGIYDKDFDDGAVWDRLDVLIKELRDE